MKTMAGLLAVTGLFLTGCSEDRGAQVRREADEAAVATKNAAKATGEAAQAVGDKVAEKTAEGVKKAAEATERVAEKVKAKVKE